MGRMRFTTVGATWLCCLALGVSGCGTDDETSDRDGGAPDGTIDADADADAAADTDTGTDESYCDIPFIFDDSEVIPPNGATINADYNPLLFQLWAPVAKEGCEGDFEIEVSITAGSSFWGDVFCGNVAQGDLVTGYLDTTGTVEGDVIHASFYLGEVGAEFGIGFDRELYYGGPRDPVEVTSCLAFASNAGAQLDIRCNGLAPGGMPSLIDGWSLSGGPGGAAIDGDGIIASVGTMEVDEVGSYDYSVIASDAINSSAPYDFAVPVDLRAATLEFTDMVLVPVPAGGNGVSKSTFEHRALLPESAADLIAQACAGSFDPASKPGTASDEPYLVELDLGCVQDAIDTLPADQREALYFYPVWTGAAAEKISAGRYFEDYPASWSSVRIEYRSDVD